VELISQHRDDVIHLLLAAHRRSGTGSRIDETKFASVPTNMPSILDILGVQFGNPVMGNGGKKCPFLVELRTLLGATSTEGENMSLRSESRCHVGYRRRYPIEQSSGLALN
jgi:hypothetical protein